MKKLLGTWGTILLVLLIVAVPIIRLEFPSWKLAAAMNQLEEGDIEGAKSTLNQLINAYPNYTEAIRARAFLLVGEFEYREAYADLKQLCYETKNSDPSRKRPLDRATLDALIASEIALQNFSEARLANNEYHRAQLKAIRDQVDAGELLTSSQKADLESQEVNRDAYAKAFCGDELEKQTALNAIGGVIEADFPEAEQLAHLAVLNWAMGEKPRAMERIGRAIKMAERSLGIEQNVICSMIYQKACAEFPIGDQSLAPVKERVYRQQKWIARLNQWKNWKSLFENQTNPEGDPKPNNFVVFNQDEVDWAFERLNRAAMFIDTRGCLHWKSGDIESAIADFDIAIDLYESCLQFLKKAGPSNRDLVKIYSKGSWEVDLRQQKKSLVVMYYHRAAAQADLGREDLAEEDFARVRELGFNPKSPMY